jgi:hypothetical protein
MIRSTDDPLALSAVEVQPRHRVAFDCAQAERLLEWAHG